MAIPIAGVIAGQMVEVLTSFCGNILSYITIEKIISMGVNAIDSSSNNSAAPINSSTDIAKEDEWNNGYYSYYKLVAQFCEGIINNIFSMNFGLINDDSLKFSICNKYCGGAYVQILIGGVRSGSIRKVNDNISISDIKISEVANKIIELFQKKGYVKSDDICDEIGIPIYIANYLMLNRDIITRNKIDIGYGDFQHHVIYSAENQKDIYGEQLVYGKVTIIKYKDTKSDVYTYGVTFVQKGTLEENVTKDTSLGGMVSDLLGTISSFISVGKTNDIEVYELPYKSLNKFISIIYKNYRI